MCALGFGGLTRSLDTGRKLVERWLWEEGSRPRRAGSRGCYCRQNALLLVTTISDWFLSARFWIRTRDLWNDELEQPQNYKYYHQQKRCIRRLEIECGGGRPLLKSTAEINGDAVCQKLEHCLDRSRYTHTSTDSCFTCSCILCKSEAYFCYWVNHTVYRLVQYITLY